MIRDMFEDMPIFSSFMLLIICLLAFILVDVFASKPEYFDGIVIDK